jgi:hypothetical protein
MEKENTKSKTQVKKAEDALDPCTSPQASETSRPTEDEDACDDGVK